MYLFPNSLHFIDLAVNDHFLKHNCNSAAAVAQWVRVFAPQAEDWVFESQPRQTLVVTTGSDSFTAERSVLGVSVMGSQR